MSSVYYRDVPYYHDENNVTLYDVQEIQYEGRPSAYVISESQSNQGPGFDNPHVRDAVAHDMAESIQEGHDVGAREVNLYQQRPDGDFDRVQFREIGHDGSSEANQEWAWEQPNIYAAQQEAEPQAQDPGFTESGRSLYERADVERSVGEQVQAPEETPQQARVAEQEREWQEMSGPSVDRVAEANDQADIRAAQQVQQLNQHVDQQEHGHDY